MNNTHLFYKCRFTRFSGTYLIENSIFLLLKKEMSYQVEVILILVVDFFYQDVIVFQFHDLFVSVHVLPQTNSTSS